MATKKIPEFTALLEKFDMMDKETYLSITHINESEQREVVANMVRKVYDSMAKYKDGLDIGIIAASKGDLDKIPGFEVTLECIATCNKIADEYKLDKSAINVVNEAITNLRNLERDFTKAYQVGAQVICDIYETTTFAVIAATSVVASEIMKFVAIPQMENTEKKGFLNYTDYSGASNNLYVVKIGGGSSKSSLPSQFLFVYLSKFNDGCRSGNMKTLIEKLIKVEAKGVTGAIEFTIMVGVVIGLLALIVPAMREIIFFFYFLRTKISDFFTLQSEMLNINAAKLDTRGDKKIAADQRKWADKFRRISDAVEVDMKDAENKAIKEVKKTQAEEKSAYKITDVKDSLPDGAAEVSSEPSSSLF